MGTPRFAPADISLLGGAEADTYALDVTGQTVEIGAVSMGNPHAGDRRWTMSRAPVERLGPTIETHPRFPQRVNVGFMAVKARDTIDLRVFERGVGETLACGTGACAAVVVGRRRGLLDERVRVRLPGGELVISWDGNDDTGVDDWSRRAGFRRQHRPMTEDRTVKPTDSTESGDQHSEEARCARTTSPPIRNSSRDHLGLLRDLRIPHPTQAAQTVSLLERQVMTLRDQANAIPQPTSRT